MAERRYAVLIGSSKFPDEPRLDPLRCPENDVDGLNTILKTYGDFTESTVLKNVRHYEALDKIYEALAGAKRDGFAVIYYSGHGKRDQFGRLFLATHDTIIDKLVATSIPVETIRSYIDDVGCQKVVLMLDCCYSGAAGRAFKSSTEDELQRLVTEGRGTYLMTASTGVQVAVEKEGDQYGVFTKHIIDGIQSGEADLDRDGYVKIDELYDYVHKHMVQEGQQRPTKWALDVRGDLIIARNPQPVKPAELPQELQEAITSPSRGIRIDAIEELDHLIRGRHKGKALAAEAALLQLRDDDDSSKVRQVARACLENYAKDVGKPSAERSADVRAAQPEVLAATEGIEGAEAHRDYTVNVAPLDAPQAKPPVVADPTLGTATFDARLAEGTVQDAGISTEPVLERSPADPASDLRAPQSGGQSALLAGTEDAGRAPTVQMVEPAVKQVIGPPLGEPGTLPPAIETRHKLEKAVEGEHITARAGFPHILKGMAALLGVVAIGVLVFQIMRPSHSPEQIVRPSQPSEQTSEQIVRPSQPSEPRPISYATIDVPGATYTNADGINSGGQIVGSFWQPREGVKKEDLSGMAFAHQMLSVKSQGFLRDAAGAFTTIEDTTASRSSSRVMPVRPRGINSAGDIVGSFTDGSFTGAGKKWHGFLRSAAGAFTIIKVPGATETHPYGINSAGVMVGSFADAGEKWHGFLRSAAGAFTIIKVPGATETDAYGINNAGEMVGSFTDADKKTHGFLRSAAGAFTTLDAPGANKTVAHGINDAGQIAGTFYTGEWNERKWHGFVTRR